jgi:hypothetical protein
VVGVPDDEVVPIRFEVTISKMNNGKRRPCCFNRAAYTDPEVSKNGKLIGLR